MRGANTYDPLRQMDEHLSPGEWAVDIPDQPEIDPAADRQADIDRALGLEAEQESSPEQVAEAPSQEDYVAPERWTDSGGMVEQQQSAMEWLEHSDDVRRERAAKQEFREAADELTNDDRELLDAARETEAQNRQPEMSQVHIHEPSGP